MSPSMRVSDLPQPTFQKEVPNPGAAGEAWAPDMPDRETGPRAAPRALPHPPGLSSTIESFPATRLPQTAENRKPSAAEGGGGGNRAGGTGA